MDHQQPAQQQPYPYPYPAPLQQPVMLANAPPQQPVMFANAPPQQPAAIQYVPSQQPGVQFVPVPQGGVPLPQMQPVNLAQFKPSHNLVLTAVVTIACAIFNLTSLMIGGPAVICAYMAYTALIQDRYSTTKNLGYTAAALSVANIAYTGIVSILIVGLSIGLHCDQYRYDSYYYYYYYEDRC